MTSPSHREPAVDLAAEARPPRVRRRATSYFGDALDALGGRLGRSSKNESSDRGKLRLEEVLERDRALRGREFLPSEPPPAARAPQPAAPQPAAPRASAPQATPASGPSDALMRSRARREGDEPDAVEPIRTRTMARLLAAQGYPRRALAILQELHIRDPEDAEVQALIAQITNGRL
jgi:hypothetical protein